MEIEQSILNKWPAVENHNLRHPAALLARYLLGYYLVHASADGITVGRIVETEAYLGLEDAAAHAYRGFTERTKALFGPAGYAYIYLSYGIHYCFNVTAGKEGDGQGVLIRALEPIYGLDIMLQRRRLGLKTNISLSSKPAEISKLVSLQAQVTNGPGKLVQAMGITKQWYGHDLSQPPLYLSAGKVSDNKVATGPRIGISQAVDLPLRYWLEGNSFVSKPNRRM